MNKNVVIFGGGGLVGSFMRRIFNSQGYCVRSVDKRDSTAVDDITLDCLKTIDERPDILEWASILVFALPEKIASNCLETLAPKIRPDKHRLINTCSAQLEFHDQVDFLCSGFESVGVNPMFSPSLDSAGRPVIVCEATQTSLGKEIEGMLLRENMNVIKLTPVDHDDTMSLCQGLPHALILSFLFSIPANQKQLAFLLTMAPPPMQTLMCLAARVADTDPSIYWGIQKHNRATLIVLKRLQESIEELRHWVENDAESEFNNEILNRKNELDDIVSGYAKRCADIFSFMNSR